MAIHEVIKYEGDNQTFVWKHPVEDFNTGSHLIVHESQEVVFFSDGKALDVFGPGKYELSTKNLPVVSALRKLLTGGQSQFHCEVYFVNKTEQMAIRWGVGNINFLDPVHNNYAFLIGANGEMSIRVSDSVKLLTKLVGTESLFDQEHFRTYFKSSIATHIKSLLPAVLKEKGVSIFEVEESLSALSDILREKIGAETTEYGIALEKFWINSILKPENDPVYISLNRQRSEKILIANQGELDLQKAEYEKKRRLIEHSGVTQSQRMDIDTERYAQEQLGYSYQQKRGFDVMDKVAENEGSGSDFRNYAMGIGMGLGTAGAFRNAVSDIAGNTMNDLTAVPKSGTSPESSESADTKKETDGDEMTAFKNKLDKLKMMKESGLLSDEEFEERRQKLLDSI